MDTHKDFYEIVEMDKEGNIREEKCLASDRNTLTEYASQIPPGSEVVFEASWSWRYTVEIFREHANLHMADPRKSRGIDASEIHLNPWKLRFLQMWRSGGGHISLRSIKDCPAPVGTLPEGAAELVKVCVVKRAPSESQGFLRVNHKAHEPGLIRNDEILKILPHALLI